MEKAQLIILKAELANDPLGRGYSGMTNAQLVTSLNTKDRPHNKDILTGQELFYNTVQSEYASKTDFQKLQWLSFCGIGEIDPFNATVQALVISIFGAGSDTVANLVAARVELISRAQEGGISVVTLEDVEKTQNNEDLQ